MTSAQTPQISTRLCQSCVSPTGIAWNPAFLLGFPHVYSDALSPHALNSQFRAAATDGGAPIDWFKSVAFKSPAPDENPIRFRSEKRPPPIPFSTEFAKHGLPSPYIRKFIGPNRPKRLVSDKSVNAPTFHCHNGDDGHLLPDEETSESVSKSLGKLRQGVASLGGSRRHAEATPPSANALRTAHFTASKLITRDQFPNRLRVADFTDRTTAT